MTLLKKNFDLAMERISDPETVRAIKKLGRLF